MESLGFDSQNFIPFFTVSRPALGKVQVNLCLCLTNQTLRYEGVWGSGCIDLRIPDLSIRTFIIHNLQTLQ
jgi:hypothetical protein